MSLLLDHEENLSLSLEDPDKFGVAIKLIDTNDVEYEFYGQANNISRHFALDAGAGDEVAGEKSNVTIRLKTFLTLTTVDIEDIKTELENWKVQVSFQPTLQTEKTFLIEQGGIFPDRHLGIITIFLTEVDIS